MNIKTKIIKILSIGIAVLTAVASVFAFKTAKELTVLPKQYINTLIGVLLGVNLLYVFVALSKKCGNLIKTTQIILCALLSGLLIFCSIKVPEYKGKFERMFVELPDVTTLNMNVYALKESENETIKDLVGKKIGVQTLLDQEHQTTAIEDIQSQVKKKGQIEIAEYEDVYSLTEALFNNEVDGILMTDVYAEIIADNADFSDFNDRTKILYNVTQEIVDKHIQEAIPTVVNTPFVIAIAGNDSWTYDNIMNNNGRTDVNIVMVVNPLVKKVLMVTLTRDAYLPINGELEKMDRLTNASVLGVDAWEKAIEYALDVKINYYFRLSFHSLIDLVNYIGGIDIYNPYYFRSGKGLGNGGKGYYYFYEGNTHLSGNMALSYVRERKSLPKGDFDRNWHQALVLKGIIDKILNSSIINNVDNLLGAAEGKIVTDFKTEDIYKLVQMQLRDNAEWQFEIIQVYGEETMESSYTAGGGQGHELMYVCHLDENMVNTANEKIAALLNEDIED